MMMINLTRARLSSTSLLLLLQSIVVIWAHLSVGETLTNDDQQPAAPLSQASARNQTTILVAAGAAASGAASGGGANDTSSSSSSPDKLILDRLDHRTTRSNGNDNNYYNDHHQPVSPHEGMRNLRDTPLAGRLSSAAAGAPPSNTSNAFEILFKKKPYSRYWSVEQKWDDLFKRFKAVQGTFKQMAVKSFMRDLEYYADVTISGQCERDLKFIQNYASKSTNVRWLFHMFDATGKNEPGMLTGNLAHLGHVVQCIRARAPSRPSNDTFDERFFEQQSRQLGERFRGKYCLASIRPVLPEKPRLVSRFSGPLDTGLISNLSFTGEPVEALKRRAKQMTIDSSSRAAPTYSNRRLDQVPFESELYQYLIEQRNFMYTLPRYMGVCYPSSCSQEDIRVSLQKTFDEQHQVVDMEFECELEEASAWQWFKTPRLVAYVLLVLVAGSVVAASLARYILVDKLKIERPKLAAAGNWRMDKLLGTLEMLSMDKCAGILFIKTKRASSLVDWTKVENNRSNSIDALKGLLILMLVYSQLAMLGCLPVPFMWSKWADAMFPFYRSLFTQIVMNTMVWTEAFYMISGYLIALKLLENHRPATMGQHMGSLPRPNFVSSLMKRYVRLVMPMVAMILLNYVWPRLSNGFVMQDQAEKILGPCDSFAWTNMLMFHNYYHLNETCLWPSHVSASFFQLHLVSYPIVLIYLHSLRSKFNSHYGNNQRQNKLLSNTLGTLAFGLVGLLALAGALYPALTAYQQDLIVPFLIDYIDYDNYQRVLEWMVLPSHNHLTSYVIGLGLAFLVIRRRVELERRRASSSDWSGHYIHRESSFGSVESTANLGGPQRLELPSVFNSIHHQDITKEQQVGKLNIFTTRPLDAALTEDQTVNTGGWFWSFCKSCLVFLAMLLTLSASWFWNGLGQPMSRSQTFAYVSLTKLGFSLTFAYLFYKHFATRKNSNVPWMVTRFLVPIGRMSLMVFYMSWLVIWFDLLSSLYQWHPSHYFLAEKYNEIIFMTLVLAIFSYGAFEGTIKRLQYATRLARAKADQEQLEQFPTTTTTAAAAAATNIITNHQSLYINHMKQRHRQQVKRFESFFQPVNKKTTLSDGNNRLPPLANGKSSTIDNNNTNQQKQLHPTISVLSSGNQLTSTTTTTGAQDGGVALTAASLLPSSSSDYLTTGYPTSRHLSPADQCKLNAELRANYSFASIGLYESVGATGELTELSSTTTTTGGDPQVTPPNSSHRHP